MTPVPLPRQLVARPRLLATLDHGSSLTLLRAPTGFGKTALVQQWIDQCGAPDLVRVAVRVRPGEGDAASFWITVMEALSDAGLTPPSLAHLRSPQSSAARMISAAGRPVVLWVDSFENVTAPAADEVLLDLVHHVPHFRLVVGTRSHQHFREHLTHELEVTLLRAADLQFTADETAAGVRAAGLDLPDDSVAAIHDGLSGWPELVRTYAVAFRGRAARDLDVPASIDQLLTDWLRGRLLPGANRPELVDLAVVSALPDQVTVELAEHLTGDPDTKSRFEDLVAEGALMPVQGSDSTAFHWPPTARRALLAELRRRGPDRVPQLQERLARWHLDHEAPAAALRHAVEAGAWELAMEVIDRSWRRLMLLDRALLNDALLRMPAAAFEQAGPVRPARAVRSVFLRTHDPLVSADALPASEQGLDELGEAADAAATLSTGLAVLIALRTPRRLPEATILAERLVRVAEAARLTQPEQVADICPSVLFFAGDTLLSAGEIARAIPHLEDAYRSADDSPFAYLEGEAAGRLAAAFALAGDLPTASTWIERREGAPQARTSLSPYAHSARNVARLLIAVDRLDLGAAVDVAHSLVGDVLPDARWAQELYARALLAAHTGGAASILELIDRARRRQSTIPACSEPLVAAVEAEMLLAMGHGNQARAVLYGEHRDHHLLRVGQARLALLAGDSERALGLASDPDWVRQARYRQRQEMLLIRAVAAHRVGEASVAAQSLHSAVAAASATGAVRAFLTVPRADLEAMAAGLPSAGDVLGRPPVEGAQELFGRPISLIELTPREEQVLQRIAEGLSIRQAAIDLHVAYSTVRTQQRSLYRKLGVESRESAVARARQAGLLAPPVRPPS